MPRTTRRKVITDNVEILKMDNGLLISYYLRSPTGSSLRHRIFCKDIVEVTTKLLDLDRDCEWECD